MLHKEFIYRADFISLRPTGESSICDRESFGMFSKIRPGSKAVTLFRIFNWKNLHLCNNLKYLVDTLSESFWFGNNQTFF
jgi:hypothetical protein